MFEPIKIVDIELSQSLLDLVDLDSYGGVRALVRLHGTPLGVVDLPAPGDRLSAAEVHRAIFEKLSWPIIRQHLSGLIANDPGRKWTLEDLAASEPPPAYAGPWPSLSVAVCTRNRPEDILLCVEALTQLDYPGELEIIVVDNAPSDDSTEQALRERFPLAHVRYVCEPRPGLDWARNRAIDEARGEVIAYTDDDVIVDRLWARAIGQVFAENPGVMGMTGLVVPHELETEPQHLFERYGGFGRGYFQRWFAANLAAGERAATNNAGTGQCGTGANMAFRRSVFAEIGSFDPALDVGTVTNGGGDLEMYFRVIKAGHPLVYEPRAMVRHRHRRDYERFHTQITNNGVGFYSYLTRSFLRFPEERLALLRLGIWWFWYWYLRPLLLSFTHSSSVTRSRELILAEMRGAIAGLRRYQQAKPRAVSLAGGRGKISDTVRVNAQSRPGLRPHATAVRTVDIGKPLTILDDVSDYPAIHVIVERAGSLVGSFTINNYYQPVSVERLREAIVDDLALNLLTTEQGQKAQSLWEPAILNMRARYTSSSRPLPAAPIANLSISVVMATHDRPSDLRDCLRSLTTQRCNYPVEIIVVDNNPSSGKTAPVVAEFPGVVLLTEERKGPSYARNRGIAASSGTVIVMTDDDVLAPPEWLERIVAPFERSDVMLVTGNILPHQLETKSQRLFESYGGLGRGFTRYEVSGTWFRSFRGAAVPTWILGGTANVACRASIFSHPEIGMLNEVLGPGTPTGVGEDTYLFYKVLKADYTIIYEPNAYLWHRHRRDMRALRRQIYGYSKGHVAYHLTTLIQDGDLRALPHVLVKLPYWHMRTIAVYFKRLLRGRVEYPLHLTLLEISGNLAGPFKLIQSYRRVRQLGRSTPYVPPQKPQVPTMAAKLDVALEQTPVPSHKGAL
jgi:glycosyltransferase involved in cell wall biosynthesis